MSHLSITIRGPQAAAAADQLMSLLSKTFGSGADIVRDSTTDEDAGRLLVPAAVLAPLDMADRLERTAKVEAVIKWAEGKAATGCVVALAAPGETPVDLARASPETVLEAARAAHG